MLKIVVMKRVAYGVLELFPKRNDLYLVVVDCFRVLEDDLMIRLCRGSQISQLPLQLLDFSGRVAVFALFRLQLRLQFIDLRINSQMLRSDGRFEQECRRHASQHRRTMLVYNYQFIC